MNAIVGEQQCLKITRTFQAQVEKVFSAWTQAELIAKWFGPDEFVVTSSTLNVTVGGAYHIHMQAPNGNLIKHFGEYVEIIPNESLIFTWILDDQECQGSKNVEANTLVSLTFIAKGNSTELTLRHERLPSREAFDGHQFGWTCSLDALEKYLVDQA